MTFMFKTIHYCQLMYLRTIEICLKIYELDPANFYSAPELAWQAALKKTWSKLYLLLDIDMFMMVKKLLEKKYVSLFIDMQKLIAITWNTTTKIKNCHNFNIVMQIIYTVGNVTKASRKKLWMDQRFFLTQWTFYKTRKKWCRIFSRSCYLIYWKIKWTV